jgi:hypothetical protein
MGWVTSSSVAGWLEERNGSVVEEQDHPMNHWLWEKDMNMVEDYYHPTNHWLEVEDMDMVGIYVVEVEGMDMVEEHPLNHRLEV